MRNYVNLENSNNNDYICLIIDRLACHFTILINYYLRDVYLIYFHNFGQI